MNIEEFKARFIDLKNKGYVESLRRGPTGIGKTLESYLGIIENNLDLPDLDNVELKAHRDNSTNMITLFTFNRGAWILNPLEAVKKYGTKDKNGRLGLYFTMSFQANSAGLFLYCDNETVSIRHIDGTIIVRWKFLDLEEQFDRKIPALILVKAKVEYRNNKEWFYFYSAELLKGTTSSIIAEQIKNGTLLIDLRLHDKGTMARNHGTGFRTYEKYLPNFFKTKEVIV